MSKAFSLARQLQRRINGSRAQRGVTLIELMLTLSVMAILLGIAAPNFRSFVINSRLSANSAEFLGALQKARSEAIRISGVVTMRLNGSAGSGDWGSAGWTMFADGDGDGVLDVGERVIAVGTPLPAPLTMIGSANFDTFIAFDRDGRLANAGAGVLVLCHGPSLIEGSESRSRAIVINGAGRVRIARNDSAGVPQTDIGAVASCTNP